MINITRDKRRKYSKAKKRSKGSLKISSERPRMLVFRSKKYLYVQVLDDLNGKVICALSSISRELKDQKLGKNIKSAAILGKEVAKKLKGLSIESVGFDRNGFKFHGKIKALADACRAEGIKF